MLNLRRAKEHHCGQLFLLETGIVQVGTSFSRRAEEQSDSLGANVPLIYRTWAHTLTVPPVLHSSWPRGTSVVLHLCTPSLLMATVKKKGAYGGKSRASRNDGPASQPPNLDQAGGSPPRPAINRILSDEDEGEVAEWIYRWLDHGFLLDNQKQVSAFARYFMKIANHPSKDVGVSDEFYEGLFRRIPSVKRRVQAARKACKSAKLKNEGREAKEERLAAFPAFLRGLQWDLHIPSQHHYVFGDTGFMTAINSEHQDLCIEASTRDEPEYRRMTSAIICACHDGRFLSPYMISKTTAVNQNRMVYNYLQPSHGPTQNSSWTGSNVFLRKRRNRRGFEVLTHQRVFCWLMGSGMGSPRRFS